MFGIKNPFKKEKSEKIVDSPVLGQPSLSSELTQPSNIEVAKPKNNREIEILIAKIDALKFQYEVLSEKINNIEKMVTEIYKIAKESSQ
jgi:hypothetical protein